MLFATTSRHRTRHALLTGVSVSALAVGCATPAAAASPRVFSPAWFAARVDSSAAAGAAAATTAGALTQSATTTRNLATMARQLQAMQTAQLAAANAGKALAGGVHDGLVMGGLDVAPGATAGSASWMGAALPTQTTLGGRAEVTVTQTAPQAMLTWQTFNVGSKTDLTFVQKIGTTDQLNWVVLNRVEDPAAQPSKILGSITAPGKVFIINASGIVFGAGSQVNLGSLIAATADISAAQFATGIYGAQTPDGRGFEPSFTGAAPDSTVVVDQGASIATTAPATATAAGGYVMLLGGAVTNDGEITTPSGQTVLAAGEDFILRPGYSTTGNQTATVQGSQVASCFPFTAGACAPLPAGATGTLGNATNNGLITATLGDITLVGHTVTQAGVAMSTTSVNTRGTVHLLTSTGDATANIILAPGSVTSVEPDNAATTALDSQRQSLIGLSTVNGLAHTIGSGPQLNDVSTLADRLDESRVELVTGGTVQFDASSLTMAQGGQIAVQAGNRVWAGDGAALDVSGSSGAVLPMSSNQLTVNIQGNELRDAPVNRDTGLISSNNVYLDSRLLLQVAAGTNGYSTTRDYTQGGLLEVSGYLSSIGHTIDEWAAVAGTITLAGQSVISQPTADFNIAGGSVSVQGGLLAQSYLIGPGGQLYNANTAPANLQYTGVYNGFTVSNARFGLTQTYTSTLVTPTELYQSGYSYGRDAGSVIVQAPSAVLEGQIEGGVANGADQTSARPATVTDGYALSQGTIAQPGTLNISGLDALGNLVSSAITIAGDYVPVADTITPATALPDSLVGAVQLSAAQLSAENLGGFIAQAGTQTVDVSGPIALANGGTLSLTGATVTVGAGLTARGGRITLGDVTTVIGTRTPLLPPVGTDGGVSVAPGATIDLRGLWTNATRDATNVSGEGLVNGGTLAIDSLRGLSLPAGVVIDASSGGALLAGNKQKGGAGGSVTLIGDDPSFAPGVPVSDAPVSIAATLRDYGVNGGGTLTLTAPNVLVGAAGSADPAKTVLLDPATFQTGFSDYVINGYDGLTVAPGTAVTVAEPVYTFFGPAGLPVDAPTGTDPAAVFQLMLLPTYQQNQATARLTQRKGASLAFISNQQPGLLNIGGGTIDLGAGSSITVDPGQSVRIEAYGQLTDDAIITARGGKVALVNEQQGQVAAGSALNTALELSVWVGSDATIDVAGLATTAQDSFGRSYGAVTAGGTITLGNDAVTDSSGGQLASDANVVVAQGATLDASGASASIDLLAGTTPQLTLQQPGPVSSDPTTVATAGGMINLRSYASINILGTVKAAAGGAGAAGGALSLVLEDPVFSPVNGGTLVVPNELLTPRVLTISQSAEAPLAGQAIQAGQPLPLTAYGQANISQAQISDGGFDTLALYARDLLSFDGDVSLHLNSAVTLSQGIITDTAKTGLVTITAPYVLINGGYAPQNAAAPSVGITVNTNTAWRPFEPTTSADFTVDASLIDVSNAVRFGITEAYAQGTESTTVSQPGFAQVTLNSSGDIRFLPGTAQAGTTGGVPTTLTTPGDVTLQGAQVYPTTSATATVLAGFNPYAVVANQFVPGGTITVLGNGSTPAVPYSVGGSLSLFSGTVVQDGIVRAPEGSITLGAVGKPTNVPLLIDTDFSYAVTLMPGSVTSVSLDGATIPYGGTVDGVTYTYNGAAVPSFAPAISLEGQVQTVQQGATLDLSGGGTLAGAGFITGRGGSVNTLTSPFPVFDAATHTLTTPTLSQQPVYAIVPGYQSGYAPVTPVEQSGSSGSVPAVGAQITVGAGVPGIAAGTYTLLPSYYALLPGAARVQIAGGYDAVPGTMSLGAGSYELNGTTSVANTGIATAQPVAVIVTTQAGVLLNSEFNQESFSAFAQAQAQKFGTPRAALPEDGKTLNLVFAATAAKTTALDFAGNALFNAASGGFAGQATVGGQGTSSVQLEITEDDAAPTAKFVSIEASALDALGAPSLTVGGITERSPNITTQIQFAGDVAQLQIRQGATLTAPQIFLTAESNNKGLARGAITVADGATVTTVGQGAAPFDTAGSGLYYNANGYTVVALSNGPLVFTPNAASTPADGAITIDGGASLFTEGSLNFITTKSLSLSDTANYGAQSLEVGVNTINFVGIKAQEKVAAGTLVLPSGFELTQALLSQLLGGNPATGVPALQTLVLSASGSINFAGNVAFDSPTLQSLVLNTPAIYGIGGATDTASITTGTLYWNGIETGVAGTASAASSQPAGVVTNGPGTGRGKLSINAQNIILGYGPNTLPDDQTTLNRLIEGFSAVDLTASVSFSANSRGTLSVYQAQGATYGAPGIGGDLTITTPLLTGAAASVDGITAGGTLTIAAPATGASTATTGALGAEIDLAAGSISDTGAILLNAGRLTMAAATGDVTIGAGARIDLAGQAVTLVDQTAYAGGGSLALSAATGNVTTDATSSIDVSAAGAAAGSIAIAALPGSVDLAGAIAGGADAGQTGGSFSLQAGTLAGGGTLSAFDTLNQILNTGSLYGSRSFEIATGDIVIDGLAPIQAHSISITADSGALTVTGLVDASGPAPGTITLAAGGNLTLAPSAVLNAQGSVPQTDSSGAPIEAENRATVSLATSGGTLTLDTGAAINVSSADPTALGQVILDAPRTSSGGVEDGIAIAASGSIDILGAQNIILYGSRTYTPTDANGTIEQHADPAIAGAVSLDQINTDNASFIANADNRIFLNAIAALTAYAGAYHLRPADVISSSGNLTVNGDLDFSTFRYGPLAGTAPGAGEAGMVTFRAGNNLIVNGSITDGFAAPPDATANTPDDNGWVLYRNEPLGQAVTLPADLAAPITLRQFSRISTASPVALNYAIVIRSATLSANAVVPGDVFTSRPVAIPAGGVTATGTIFTPDGMLYKSGDIIPGGTVLASGTRLSKGVVLPMAVQLANKTTWPAGALLSVLNSGSTQLVKLDKKVTLTAGAYIPAGSSLRFSGHARSVAVRSTTNGVQGLIYATASLLPPGSQSWSMNLIGGANLASANLLAVQPKGDLAGASATPSDPAGSIVLSDNHYTVPNGLANTKYPTASFSVVRTGTGSLNLVAGGNVDQASLFGVYTAGTQTQFGTSQDASFNAPRATAPDGTVLGAKFDAGNYNAVDATQSASYPDHGGDVLVAAQGDVTGDIVGTVNASVQIPTDSIGDWLWTQGGSGIGQSTSWWINFGSYVLSQVPFAKQTPVLTGFTGIGALGGGNVTVSASGNAGEIAASKSSISQGLVIAVASTGRVTAVDQSGGTVTGGTTVLTGGGSVTVDVAGTINPTLQGGSADGGTVTDTRGNIDVQAGQVGRIDLIYNAPANATDPRAQNPFGTDAASSTGGLIVVPGDGTVTIDAMRDLVLAGAGDATREVEQAQTQIAAQYLPAGPTASQYHGVTGFSLWTAQTAINLFSAGGNLTPTTAEVDYSQQGGLLANDAPTDYRFIYPGTLIATAASGSFYYGFDNTGAAANDLIASLELAPSPTGELSLVAAQSIYANGYAVDMSGAATGNALPNPYNPAYSDLIGSPFATGAITNLLDNGGNNTSPDALFAFEPDTATALHAGDSVANRVYAAAGDLVNVQIGEVLNYALTSLETDYTWYLAAKPTDIFAGQDIVSNGTLPQLPPSAGYSASTFVTYPDERAGLANDVSSGSLLLNLSSTDVSTVTAGRDILGSYFYVAGPGQLDVTAGRNIDETADSSSSGSRALAFGVIKSIGPIIDVSAANRSGGAGIAILDGAGSSGADYTGFATLYFNNANQANLAIPLSQQPGKVQQTYEDQLFAWLQTNYGYTGDESGALAYYFTLPATTQDIFVRTVFFDELLASGRQETDAKSLFFGSYARGRGAIATLFPQTDPLTGKLLTNPATNLPYYAGGITMDSGTIDLTNNGTPVTATFDAGISTLNGGDIQIISPGGGDTFGTTGGPVPGASSGVITQGSGNIAVYALNSVLLGQSRIFTTFGGNIQIWSGLGDINAGRGSKTTLIVPPPVIAYDSFGNISLTPAVPTSGAGIATLAPIAGIPPGNVDLVAPQGTVDAGEAGIRVSGNLNIAALVTAGTANIQVSGTSTGVGPVAVNVAAVSAAASAAGSSTAAATSTATQRAAAQAVQQVPSIITVEIIGGGSNDDTRRRRPAA